MGSALTILGGRQVRTRSPSHFRSEHSNGDPTNDQQSAQDPIGRVNLDCKWDIFVALFPRFSRISQRSIRILDSTVPGSPV